MRCERRLRRSASSRLRGFGFLGDGLARALHGQRQPVLFHRLQQIIQRLPAERLDRVLIVGGGQHEIAAAEFLLAQLADHAHAVQAGHLHVQKHQVGLQVFDQLHRFEPLRRGGHDLDVGELLELIGEFFGGEFLIVHQRSRRDDGAAVARFCMKC